MSWPEMGWAGTVAGPHRSDLGSRAGALCAHRPSFVFGVDQRSM